ncbi:MAG TPA: ferritin-like domain-containing protein [Blastocatellia bacterium]|nr:ferritin-like domain-containing protein [Blastocatellia bacterium]
MTTSPEQFVASLAKENEVALQRLGQLSSAGEPAESLTIERLLRVALKNELEATEVAAVWLATTDELDVKLALARQVGDESKHYNLISRRLSALGADLHNFDPRDGGYSPLFQFLVSLTTTPERVAAGQFTREGIALIRNQLFIDFCESTRDDETAALYRDVIQPDERHHHELGRELLVRYARSQQQQAAAKEAARRTLALAEEIQEMARMRAGISRAPGC